MRACATASRDESEFIRRLRDEGVRLRPRYAEGGTEEVVGYSVRLPGREHGPQRSVWYGGGRLARDLTLPALRRGWRQDAEAQRRAVREWSSSTSAAPRVAGRAPGRARAARADVAPLHDGARARPPAAPSRRHRPRRDRARRPRGRRRPRRLVAGARGRAAGRARPRRPAARALGRAARAHAGAAEAALARVRAGAVHARRRQARQRRRMADRLARDRAPRRRARPRCTAPAASSSAPSRSRASSAPSSRRSKRRSSVSARARTRSSTPRRRPPSVPGSHCRRPARDPGQQRPGETEDIKRLINPLRGRRPPGAVRPTNEVDGSACPACWRGAVPTSAWILRPGLTSARASGLEASFGSWRIGSGRS